jgi:Family of unknown function (DUF5687)
MFKKFLYLEWKAFSRSASFGTHLAIKIVLGFLAVIYAFGFLVIGIGGFYGLKKLNLDPFLTVNKYLIYYFIADLSFRLLAQKTPVITIRPLLVLPFQ